jgi:hypothetical protein
MTRTPLHALELDKVVRANVAAEIAGIRRMGEHRTPAQIDNSRTHCLRQGP